MTNPFFTKFKRPNSKDLRNGSEGFFTLRRSMSKRFFQLSFEGFRPSGRNKFEQFLNTWLEFFKALLRYILNKLFTLLFLIIKLIGVIFSAPRALKSFLIRKLIWSRGRLGRPIATGAIMTVSLGVFLLGEVFNSSSLVIDQPVSADYLVSATDIVPRKDIAVTTLPEERKGTEPFKYTVQPGDSLYSIGEKFKIAVDALKYINGLTDTSILSVGQELTIPPVSGLIHKVRAGDSLASIADKYKVPVQAIADFNYILDTTHLATGSELVIPGGKIPEVVIPVVVATPEPNVSRGSENQASSNNNFCVWPTTVRIITQYYSWYHNGLDIASPSGMQMPPIINCSSGTVIRAGWDPFGLGLHIRVDHGNGYETVYGHMSRLDVSYGQKVKQGQILGLMGSTGHSTGPHVHFIVKYNGVAQDPLKFTR